MKVEFRCYRPSPCSASETLQAHGFVSVGATLCSTQEIQPRYMALSHGQGAFVRLSERYSLQLQPTGNPFTE